MPIIQVQLVAGRPREKTQELMREIAKTVIRVIDAPEETIRIVLTEIDPHHWGVGLTTKAEKDARAKSGS